MSLIVQSELQGLLDTVLGETGRLRKGSNLQYHCPFCNHRKRKLEVCLDAPYVWHCWVCHEKGKGPKYLFSKMNVSDSAFKELEKIGIKESDYQPVEKKLDESIVSLPAEFKSLTVNDGSREYRQALRYAIKRKITPYDVLKYNLGYCTEGKYKDRIIFPSYDKNNQLNFFTGRSYYDDVYLKYDNCYASRDIIGFENTLDFKFPITLVEGPLDAIAIKRNVTPLFGTFLSRSLRLELISNKTEVNVVLDPDAKDFALEIGEFLLSIGIKTKVVIVPAKDAGEMGFEKMSKLIKETDYLDFSTIMKIRLGF